MNKCPSELRISRVVYWCTCGFLTCFILFAYSIKGVWVNSESWSNNLVHSYRDSEKIGEMRSQLDVGLCEIARLREIIYAERAKNEIRERN
jgi:hypothetical protein